MLSGEVQFAVIPWTRVAADPSSGNRLTLVSGSGVEEAALVVRNGREPDEVRSVAVPQEGGIKDLTVMALIKRMGWESAEIVRMPSGDGAILSFVGEGTDAASMVEPYAAMLEHLGLGRVIQRTGDVWPGAPGCSLTTTSNLVRENPSLVQRMVDAYVRGDAFARDNPDAAAETAARYIGVNSAVIARALRSNQPNVDAIRNDEAMSQVLGLMLERGYIQEIPSGYRNLSFLDQAQRRASKIA